METNKKIVELLPLFVFFLFCFILVHEHPTIKIVPHDK